MRNKEVERIVVGDLKELRKKLRREKEYVAKTVDEALDLVEDLLDDGFSKRKAGMLLKRLERLDMCQDIGEYIYYSDEQEIQEDPWFPSPLEVLK